MNEPISNIRKQYYRVAAMVTAHLALKEGPFALGKQTSSQSAKFNRFLNSNLLLGKKMMETQPKLSYRLAVSFLEAIFGLQKYLDVS